jgi:hypothetical protein
MFDHLPLAGSTLLATPSIATCLNKSTNNDTPAQGVDVSRKPPTIFTPSLFEIADVFFIITSWKMTTIANLYNLFFFSEFTDYGDLTYCEPMMQTPHQNGIVFPSYSSSFSFHSTSVNGSVTRPSLGTAG